MKTNWKPKTDKSHNNQNVLCFNPKTGKMRVAIIQPNTKNIYWTELPKPPKTTLVEQSKSQLDRTAKKTKQLFKALELRKQGKTYREIGELLNCSHDLARTHTIHAKWRLRQEKKYPIQTHFHDFMGTHSLRFPCMIYNQFPSLRNTHLHSLNFLIIADNLSRIPNPNTLMPGKISIDKMYEYTELHPKHTLSKILITGPDSPYTYLFNSFTKI